MDSLLLAGIPTLILLALSLVFLKILQEIQKDHRMREQIWEQERSSLLNRVMTKEWTTFAQLEESKNSPSSDEVVAGMSDLEELRRMGLDIGSDNQGETLVEFPGY